MSINNNVAAQIDTEKRSFNWRDWLVYFVLIFLVILFTVLRPIFISGGNLQNIGRQTAMVSIMAFGMTFVITAGHIDLSVGSILGLSGLATAGMMSAGTNIVVASIVGLLIGALTGLINGILVAKMNIPSFLATLGTMTIGRGLALTVTGTKSVMINKGQFLRLWGASDIAGIPTSILWTALAFIICGWLYHYTKIGNHVKAVGGNRNAALYSGVKVDKTVIIVFVICGILAAVAGLIMAARLKNGRPEVGEGMELDTIAAVVLGGTAMSGGRGNIPNTLIGSLIMGVIVNGLLLLGFQANIQKIFKGIIIIAAVALSEKR